MEYEKRCEWCGKVFIAQKVTTKYCSHSCNSMAYKQKMREQQKENFEEQKGRKLPTIGKIGDKPYLSPSEVALLLGVSRASVYRSLASGEIKSLQYKRKTIIRKTDLEKLFDDSSPYKRRSYGRKESRQYYTMTEIVEKYNISRKAAKGRVDFDRIMKMRSDSTLKHVKENEIEEIIKELEPEIPERYMTAEQIAEKFNLTLRYARNIARVNKIPSVRIKQFNYYEPKAVEFHFAKYKKPEGINEWLTRQQVEEIYKMTTYAVRTFVHRHQIPSKNIHGETVYSKVHIDDVKEFQFMDSGQYLSVEQIMEK